MEQPMIFTAPPPRKELHQNSRAHWRAVSKVRRQYRALWMLLAMERKPKTPWRAAHAVVTFTFPTRIRRDPTNLLAGMKAAWDGMVDGGLLVDDDKLTVEVRPVEWAKNMPAQVVVEIREVIRG
jgi:crossover junction endodeoxyribonuclease RusA